MPQIKEGTGKISVVIFPFQVLASPWSSEYVDPY